MEYCYSRMNTMGHRPVQKESIGHRRVQVGHTLVQQGASPVEALVGPWILAEKVYQIRPSNLQVLRVPFCNRGFLQSKNKISFNLVSIRQYARFQILSMTVHMSPARDATAPKVRLAPEGSPSCHLAIGNIMRSSRNPSVLSLSAVTSLFNLYSLT